MGFSFDPEFNPVLLPNETATLKGAQFPSDGQPIMCVAFGALPEYQKDFGALVAETWKTDREDTNLEMGTNELAQLRMEVVDPMKVRLLNPAAIYQWRTAKTNFELYQSPTEPNQDWLKKLLFAMSEFFVYEVDTPRFELYSAIALTISRIIFRGWRYRTQEITQKELTSKQVIWVNSWPSSK